MTKTMLTILIGGILMLIGNPALAQKQVFTTSITDSEGVETEVQHTRLYWEEQVSDTSFVPHEVSYVPVKRGASTINVKFTNIKSIEVKGENPKKGQAILHITLKNGKTGAFPVAVDASFIGDSDFGEVKLPMKTVRMVVFK